MRTVSDILAGRKPAEDTVRLLLDGGLRARIDDTKRLLRDAARRDSLDGGGLGSAAPGLERELAELEAAADAASVEFTFRAIGHSVLDELKRRCPPTAEQLDRWREQAKLNPFLPAPEFDPEALAPLLIAASCVDPVMSVDDAARLWAELSDGEAAALFEGAWRVSQEASTRPIFGTGTDTTASSGPGSSTPQSTASPSASS